MNVLELKEFCRGFRGATETLYQEPYNFLVYSVGGKKFAYFKTSHPERWRFSTRVSPDRFIELTDVPGVKPARYLLSSRKYRRRTARERMTARVVDCAARQAALLQCARAA